MLQKLDLMKVQKEVSGGYHSLEHSYYFFGWNDDDLGIFNLVDKYWSAVKVLSGNKATDFRKNRPKDGVVDRISVIHYPEGSGYISVHCDPDKTQKTLLGCPLTTMGKDYPFGKQGFTVFDNGISSKLNKGFPISSSTIKFPTILALRLRLLVFNLIWLAFKFLLKR